MGTRSKKSKTYKDESPKLISMYFAAIFAHDRNRPSHIQLPAKQNMVEVLRTCLKDLWYVAQLHGGGSR